MTHAQNTSARNVRVTDRPTLVPVTFGWISDWSTKLISE